MKTQNMQGLIIKENITKFMFDKLNPEMITFLRPQEIERFAIIQALIDEQRKETENLNITEEDSILDDVLYNIYLLRCSVNGFRSEQGVKIINTHMTGQDNKDNNIKQIDNVTS